MRLSLALITLKWQVVKWRDVSVSGPLKGIILQITPLDNLSLSGSLNNTKASVGGKYG